MLDYEHSSYLQQELSLKLQMLYELLHRHILELNRPFILLKPKIQIDGDSWCVLYGENLQDGVCGFGDTPVQASINFDIAWLNEKAFKDVP